MFGATGCGAGAGTTDSDISYPWTAETPLRILTWWETDDTRVCREGENGEVCAGQALTRGYSEHTGGAGVEFLHHRRDDVHAYLESLPGGSLVADGAIINGGTRARGLAGCEDGGSSARLAQLGTVAHPVLDFLTERLPEDLVNLVSCDDGRLFGAVIGLHSLNRLFFNPLVLQDVNVKARLAALNLDFDQVRSVDGFLDVLAVVNDYWPKPLVIKGDPGRWSQFLVENLMVALAGPDAYDRHTYVSFWAPLTAGERPDRRVSLDLLEETLDYAEEFAPYIRVDSDPLASIASGDLYRGAFTLSGDWDTPKVASPIQSKRFPGTESAYVYTTDIAVITRDHTQGSEQTVEEDPMLGFLKAITAGNIQADYARRKNAIAPAARVGEHTHAKTTNELFEVDGVQLIGIPGLPSYVPYRSFDILERKIEKHMLCLVPPTSPSPGETSSLAAELTEEGAQPRCAQTRRELHDYVYDEYCKVISGNADDATTSAAKGCADVTVRPPRINR